MLCPDTPPQACSAASAAATTPAVYAVLTASALACRQLEVFVTGSQGRDHARRVRRAQRQRLDLQAA